MEQNLKGLPETQVDQSSGVFRRIDAHNVSNGVTFLTEQQR
jgi:hypothetical protein